MGNISRSIKNILKEAKSKQDFKKQLKSFFSPQEYKHIAKIKTDKDRLIIYLDSSIVLYELNLKKEDLLERLREKGVPWKSLIFKIGS